MQPTKSKSRILVIAVILGVLFIIITSELPLIEGLLTFLWSRLR